MHAWLPKQGAPCVADRLYCLLSGLQFIFVVFSMGIRGGMLAYVYWQNLRMRYWAPQSRPYHVQVRRLVHKLQGRGGAGKVFMNNDQRASVSVCAVHCRPDQSGPVPTAVQVCKERLTVLVTSSHCCPCNPPMQAWAALNAKAQPLLTMLPSLHRYLDYAVRWFQAPGQHRA